MKIIFFGGVQGVGKTTLLAWLEHKYTGRITLLNPGELFRRYYYRNKIKTTEEIEELITNKLLKMPNDAVIVLHWHYAVPRPSGYIPQISFSRLKRIAKNNAIEQIILFLVKAPVDIVRKRRIAEQQVKKRGLSRKIICKEMIREKEFLTKHYALFSRLLGRRKVMIFRLTNINLRAAKKNLLGFFKRLLG